jgi:hypothetical protein
MMEGIRYVTNHKGQRVAVMIDLEKYSEIWEDFYDSLLAEMRKDEPTSSLAAVKRSLRKKGKLNG